MREDTGERVVALVGTRRLRRVRDRAARAWCSRSPTGVDDGTALAMIVQGTTAWHLYRTAGRVAEGESVVVHSAAGGVGSLAGAARPPARRRTRDRDGLERGEARAGAGARRRRGDRPGRGRAHRAPDRGQRRASRWTWCSRSSGGEVFDASYKALAPFGRIVVYGIATQRTQRGAHRLAAAPLARGRRLLPVPLLCAPGDVRATRSRTCSTRAARGELRPIVGGTYPLEEAAQAQIDLRERRTTGKLLLDPRCS